VTPTAKVVGKGKGTPNHALIRTKARTVSRRPNGDRLEIWVSVDGKMSVVRIYMTRRRRRASTMPVVLSLAFGFRFGFPGLCWALLCPFFLNFSSVL
jgi:hypothetical protein